MCLFVFNVCLHSKLIALFQHMKIHWWISVWPRAEIHFPRGEAPSPSGDDRFESLCGRYSYQLLWCTLCPLIYVFLIYFYECILLIYFYQNMYIKFLILFVFVTISWTLSTTGDCSYMFAIFFGNIRQTSRELILKPNITANHLKTICKINSRI